MKLVCPSCGAVHSLEAWANDAQARDAFAALSSLPSPVIKSVLPYLSLFRDPQAKRGLSWKKTARLMGEIQQLVNAGWVQVSRRPARPASPQIWADAMNQMDERRYALDLPMNGHNYLKQIVYDMANQADRKTEVKRNKAERRGDLVQRKASGGAPPASIGDVLNHTDMDMERVMKMSMSKLKPKREKLVKYVRLLRDKGVGWGDIKGKLPENYVHFWDTQKEALKEELGI